MSTLFALIPMAVTRVNAIPVIMIITQTEETVSILMNVTNTLTIVI